MNLYFYRGKTIMSKKLIPAVAASILVVSMWGVFASALDDQDSYTIKFDPNGGSGSITEQEMPVGVKTPLNANPFENKVNISYDTAGGSPIDSDVLEYPFLGWTSMSQVTDSVTNMGKWTNEYPNYVKITYDGENDTNTITVSTKANCWEKVYTDPIYLEPNTDYTLSIDYFMPQDIRALNSNGMWLRAMSQINKGGGDDNSNFIIDGFQYNLTANEQDIWYTGNMKFKAPESGIVYLCTNYGNLADGQEPTIMYKNLKISKVDASSSSAPEALFYEDKAEVANIGESKDGIFVFRATWDMDQSITLPTPVKSCSVFKEWTDGDKSYAAGDKISPREDLALTAVWEDELIHDWDEPEYSWSDDFSTCTATRVCINDPSHIETETKNSSKSAVKSTCTEDGYFTYKVQFSNPAFAEQEKDDLGEPAKGHSWGGWKVTKAATVDAAGIETRVCSACGTKETRSTAKLTPTPVPTKAPVITVKLNKNTSAVICGKTDALKATVTGTKSAVSWKSSDTKVATVDKNGKVTTKMAGQALITATVADKSATCTVTVLYKDVTSSKDFWYAPTNYLTAKGVVKGYANQTEFRPANVCTRAQMVTFIWRLQGEPKPKAASCKFSDVKTSDYFYKACIWGNENHIVEGYKDGTFGPQIVCARKHAVTFLWRLANKPSPKSKDNKFKDVKKGDYFYTATLWASEKGILAGYSDGTFKPDGDCLRRQMVTFLYKYDKFVNGKG